MLVKRDSVLQPNGTFSGFLYLWRTSASDSSPTGRRPAAGDSLRSFYFGTTDVDLDAAEAYAGDRGAFWRMTSTPSRSDIDPIRPPILGISHSRTIGGGRSHRFILAVGTVSNDRSTGGGLDGSGIALDVTRIDTRGLFGTWDRHGLEKTGRGYFCAYRK